jgi:hypothetical protein
VSLSGNNSLGELAKKFAALVIAEQHLDNVRKIGLAAARRLIVLADGGYSSSPDGYLCGKCTAATYPHLDD